MGEVIDSPMVVGLVGLIYLAEAAVGWYWGKRRGKEHIGDLWFVTILALLVRIVGLSYNASGILQPIMVPLLTAAVSGTVARQGSPRLAIMVGLSCWAGCVAFITAFSMFLSYSGQTLPFCTTVWLGPAFGLFFLFHPVWFLAVFK